jgi:hypothetical protein
MTLGPVALASMSCSERTVGRRLYPVFVQNSGQSLFVKSRFDYRLPAPISSQDSGTLKWTTEEAIVCLLKGHVVILQKKKKKKKKGASIVIPTRRTP